MKIYKDSSGCPNCGYNGGDFRFGVSQCPNCQMLWEWSEEKSGEKSKKKKKFFEK